ncbi:MAG: lipopolysaccharide biosynthesis protein [Candidatus Omnitrophica bacterium]|nr:lipopolysaccharide biosynthesis protein [Candidatus Omnitrophota bacterium]
MENPSDFKRKMAHGLKWVSFGQVFSYIIQFGVSVFIARRLEPENFGAWGAALIFSNFFVIFNELGMMSAVIQKKDLRREHKVVALWVCVAMGFSFLVLACFGAPYVASFFKNPAVGSLVLIFAFKFFVDSFGMVKEAMLRKELLFKKLTSIDIRSNLVYGLVSVGMVLKGAGIISVGWGYLAAGVLRVILLWRTSSFGPYAEFDRASFKELFNFGKNIVGFKIVNYLTGNIDYFLIGRFLGTASLGYYGLASSLANFPRQKLSLIITNVFFPAFSKMQDDLTRVKEVYLKIIRYAAIVNFPLLLGLLMLAPQFVSFVYSSKWDAMVLPLRILCIYGLSFSMTTFIGVVYDATGHPDYSFKFCLVNFAGTVLALLIGLRYGLTGIATGLSVFSVFLNLFGQWGVRRITKMTLRSYFMSLAPACLASVVMVGILSVFIKWQRTVLFLSNGLFLLISVLAAVLVYGLALFLLNRRTFLEFFRIIRHLLGANR